MDLARRSRLIFSLLKVALLRTRNKTNRRTRKTAERTLLIKLAGESEAKIAAPNKPEISISSTARQDTLKTIFT
jgi:hypothetical protein